MAYCSKCGQSLREGTAFCGKCGNTAAANIPETIPLVPDHLLQGFLDQGIGNKANNQKAESIMNTGVFLMESAVLSSNGPDSIGIRQLTIDKVVRDDCEWKAIKEVASKEENKIVSRMDKIQGFMKRHFSLMTLFTLIPFYLGLIILIAVFVMAGINDALEEVPWGIVISLVVVLTVASLAAMPIFATYVKGFRKKMRKKYATIEPKTNALLEALTESEILKFWQDRYIRNSKNRNNMLYAYVRIFGQPSIEYLPLICDAIGINASNFTIDLGRMKGGGSTYIKWNATDGARIAGGLTALSHLMAAADNAAVNVRREFVENIIFYNNLAAHFNKD